MGLRDQMSQLRASLRGQLSSFELADGTRYWFHEAEAFEELFLFGTACLRAGRAADRPEPPEIVRALAEAQDRRAAFDALGPLPFWPFEREAFVRDGLLIHRSLIAGRDVDGSACADLSEPGEDS